MVKKTIYSTVTHTDTNIDNIDSMHQMGIYNDKIYFIERKNTATTIRYNIYSLPKDDLTAAATYINKFDTDATYTTLTSAMFKCTSTGLMCAAMTATDGGTNWNRVCYYSVDGGVNWTRKSYTTTTATYNAIRIAMINFNLDDDAIAISQTMYRVSESKVWLTLTKANNFDVNTYDTPLIDNSGVDSAMQMAGIEDIYMDSRNIADPANAGQYLISYATVPSTDATKLIFMSYGFDASSGGSSSSSRSTITNYTKPASMDIDRQALEYDLLDYSFFIMDSTQFIQSYEDSSTISLRVVAETYTQHAIAWLEDYTFTHFCFDGLVYVDWGLPYIPLQNIAQNIGSGIYLYFIKNTATIYGRSIATATDLIICELKTTKELERSAKIISNTAFLDRQGYELYNDSDVLQMRGMIGDTDEDTGQYTTILIDPAKRDLDRLITYSATGVTISTALTAIFAANNNCLTIGTISTGATTRDFDYKGKPLRSILTEMAHTEGMIWYYNGSWQVYINAGTTDSTVNILSSAGNVPTTVRKFKRITIGQVELTVVGGVKITKYAVNGGTDILTDRYPDMTEDQGAELAQQLADKGSVTITAYKIRDLIITQWDAGTQIDFEQDIEPYNQASAKFYTEYIVYDLIRNMIVEAEIMDQLYITSVAQSKIENVSAHIQKVEATADAACTTTTFNAFNAIGSANAQYKPCILSLESAVGKVTTNFGTFENVDGTDINLTYMIPLEPLKGTLHLHVDGLKISLTDADANNYITDIRLRGTTNADPPVDSALVTGGTDYNTIDVFTTAITDTDLSSYVHYILRVDCVVDTAAALNIAGIWIKYYYA